jgi:hypothetical protein
VAYAAAGSSCSSSGAGSTAATARTIFAAAAGIRNATVREIKKTDFRIDVFQIGAMIVIRRTILSTSAPDIAESSRANLQELEGLLRYGMGEFHEAVIGAQPNPQASHDEQVRISGNVGKIAGHLMGTGMMTLACRRCLAEAIQLYLEMSNDTGLPKAADSE